MQKKTHFTFITNLLLIILLLSQCSPKNEEPQKAPEKETSDPEISQWKEVWGTNRISLFIHFGVYSTLGGEWNNKDIKGPAENIQAIAGIGADKYQQIASNFSPKKWNPEEIIALAKDINAKTIVFTVKHHDGFCLFKTETTSFNIVDFTQLNRDLLADLAKACKKANIGLGINYSLTDWHLPAAWPITSRNGAPITHEHHQYNLRQIKELLTNYDNISSIYFYSGLPTPAQSKEMHDLIKEIQPQCLISNGIGNDMGDFLATPFNQPLNMIPETPWIYRSAFFPPSLGFDKNKKTVNALQTARSKIRELVNVVSSGGNYAVNIAPQKDGSLDPMELEILNHMGRWIKVNDRALTRTNGNSIGVDSKFWSATWKNNSLYLFVDSVPASQKIVLSKLNYPIKEVKFLGSGIETQFFNREQQHEIIWTSPAMADPMQLPVLEISMNGPLLPLPEKQLVVSPIDTVILSLTNAITAKSMSGIDQLAVIPSITNFKWNLKTQNPLKATLRFTDHEAGRSVIVETASSKSLVQLQGKANHFIRSTADTLQTGSVFRSMPYYGPFEELHINPKGENRLQISRSSWNVLSQKRKNITPLPLTNYYYFVEITSESPQQYCFQVTGNEGIQLWLNTKEVLKKNNLLVDQPLVCKIVLNLKKGMNILLIRNFNRWGKDDQFSLAPLPDARWRTQPLEIPENPGFIKVMRATSSSPHADIDLPNFSIELTPQN
ncbi:alpha-L-fucosidase [Thermophagus sp. OGC60D27]|uniref:alpha-L-fucosidase n=1 Tax=Thermophagus sp. OGC60D27 TaxID=3458415 RepID=UPI0040382FFE